MTTLVFGSCMMHDGKNGMSVWADALAHRPDWLLLGGDNVYLDYFPTLGAPAGWTVEKFATELFERYREQFHTRSLRALANSIPAGQVIGTWDDHDFCWNNCYGADTKHDVPKKRRIARVLFHHYFQALNLRPLPAALPAIPLGVQSLLDHPFADQETYNAFDLDPFRVLVCDGRYYRERWDGSGATNTASLLGATQEAWLLNEIKQAQRPILIISGSTLSGASDQAWDYYTDFYIKRLQPALKNKVALYLGGDIHKNRLHQHPNTKTTEVVSSAVRVPFSSRRYGVIDFNTKEAKIFLYRRGEVDTSGILDFGTGKLAMAMAEVQSLSTSRAAAQRRAAVMRIRGKK
ncbi:MAG: alkaline phosphatase D family protein [Rhodanobacteraceae bacterium]|nr:alkaline phosphatase D family protein [Rhodanobacteraceae bacterium]